MTARWMTTKFPSETGKGPAAHAAGPLCCFSAARFAIEERPGHGSGRARLGYGNSGIRSAAMARRIAAPSQHRTGCNHGAADIADRWRGAPGTGAIPFRIASRSALESRTCDKDMACGAAPLRAAQQPHQRVARDNPAGARAGVSRAARAIDLPRRYPSEPDPWSLATPDRAIAIPDPDGCAGERLAVLHDRDGQQKYSEHQRSIRKVA